MARVHTCVNASRLFPLSHHPVGGADKFFFVPSNWFKLMCFQNYIPQDKGEQLPFPNKKAFTSPAKGNFCRRQFSCWNCKTYHSCPYLVFKAEANNALCIYCYYPKVMGQ